MTWIISAQLYVLGPLILVQIGDVITLAWGQMSNSHQAAKWAKRQPAGLTLTFKHDRDMNVSVLECSSEQHSYKKPFSTSHSPKK